MVGLAAVTSSHHNEHQVEGQDELSEESCTNGEVWLNAICSKAGAPECSWRHELEETAANETADELSRKVHNATLHTDSLEETESKSNSKVEVTAADVADGITKHENRESKGQSNTNSFVSSDRVLNSGHAGTASDEDENHRTDQLSEERTHERLRTRYEQIRSSPGPEPKLQVRK